MKKLFRKNREGRIQPPRRWQATEYQRRSSYLSYLTNLRSHMLEMFRKGGNGLKLKGAAKMVKQLYHISNISGKMWRAEMKITWDSNPHVWARVIPVISLSFLDYQVITCKETMLSGAWMDHGTWVRSQKKQVNLVTCKWQRFVELSAILLGFYVRFSFVNMVVHFTFSIC